MTKRDKLIEVINKTLRKNRDPATFAIEVVDTILSARPELSEQSCKKCGGGMERGKATGQTFVGGMPDFPDDKHSSTFSAGGAGKLIDCMKCSNCGWSVTGTELGEQTKLPRTRKGGGWVLDHDLLEATSKKISDDGWDHPTKEVVEMAMLEAERIIFAGGEL